MSELREGDRREGRLERIERAEARRRVRADQKRMTSRRRFIGLLLSWPVLVAFVLLGLLNGWLWDVFSR